MAEVQHLLVLANSIKYAPGVCIAGRQIRLQNGQCYLGPWTRPVSRHPNGELLPDEIRLAGGGRPKVFDIVEVPLADRCDDPTQPENWWVRPRTNWRKAGKSYRSPPRELLVEHPVNLWLESHQRCDRVSAAYLEDNPPEQSLCLVRVQNLHARFEWDDREGFYRPRYRALFSYNGDNYEMNITDPRFIARHQAMLLPAEQKPIVFPVNKHRDTPICVSLAREFNGYHYKVVATIFA